MIIFRTLIHRHSRKLRIDIGLSVSSSFDQSRYWDPARNSDNAYRCHYLLAHIHHKSQNEMKMLKNIFFIQRNRWLKIRQTVCTTYLSFHPAVLWIDNIEILSNLPHRPLGSLLNLVWEGRLRKLLYQDAQVLYSEWQYFLSFCFLFHLHSPAEISFKTFKFST